MATDYTKRTKPSTTWLKRRRLGLIWDEAHETWDETPETWDSLGETTYTKRTKPTTTYSKRTKP